MSANQLERPPQQGAGQVTPPADDPAKPKRQALQRYYQGQQHLRRGICLLNAGQFDLARSEFLAADQVNPHGQSLARLLAACHVGQGEHGDAAAALEEAVGDAASDVTLRIQQALLLWRDGQGLEAIETLRRSVHDHPNSAELHFQLGTLLAANDQFEEAELRFTQAVAIERNHTDALVALAQCCAVDVRLLEAKRYLERAQRRRPHDPRIALLLVQAGQSLAEQGLTASVQADIPNELSSDDLAVDQLSQIVEREPEFIDAFLGLPPEELEVDVYSVLAEILNRAVERSPGQAALHCARGDVLQRLGRSEEAINATEQALTIEPRFVRGLIQLARLYEQTNRDQDAVDRLEQVLELGAEYADVYYLLGNLYRRTGRVDRARWAYHHALRINEGFEAARKALATLAA